MSKPRFGTMYLGEIEDTIKSPFFKDLVRDGNITGIEDLLMAVIKRNIVKSSTPRRMQANPGHPHCPWGERPEQCLHNKEHNEIEAECRATRCQPVTEGKENTMSYGQAERCCNMFRTWESNPGLCGRCAWPEKDHRTAFQPHQQRVIEEFKQLSERRGKLREFIYQNSTFKSIAEDEQQRLQKQFKIMGEYEEILLARISHF